MTATLIEFPHCRSLIPEALQYCEHLGPEQFMARMVDEATQWASRDELSAAAVYLEIAAQRLHRAAIQRSGRRPTPNPLAAPDATRPLPLHRDADILGLAEEWPSIIAELPDDTSEEELTRHAARVFTEVIDVLPSMPATSLQAVRFKVVVLGYLTENYGESERNEHLVTSILADLDRMARDASPPNGGAGAPRPAA
jgi:hypothetical protein